MHPVERGGLGGPHVGADVLERVVAKRHELPVACETGLDLGDPSGRRAAGSEVLHAVLRPAHGDAERARREADEHDVRKDRRLDAERAARVGRREQPQPVAAESEGGGRDAVQRERPLEVRPGGQPPGRLVPVADDAIALDGKTREARHPERRPDDEIGRREGVVDVPVVEAALVDRLRGRGIDDGLERLVVDGDELGRVLGEVPIPGDDHRKRLADVAGRFERRGPVRHG